MIVKTNKVEKTDNGFYIEMCINKKKVIKDKPLLINRIQVIILYLIYHLSLYLIQKILHFKVYEHFKYISILFMVITYYFLLNEKIYLYHFI